MTDNTDFSVPESRFRGKFTTRTFLQLLLAVIAPLVLVWIVQFNPLSLRLTIFLSLLVLAFGGYIIWKTIAQIIQPIQQITTTALHFADGDLQKRAIVDRTDELGLLAFAFNQMADEMSNLYRSLEIKVNQRTRQIQTAAEVARAATSASSLDEILQLTVDLIVQRFDHYHAAIYLVDPVKNEVVQRAASGEAKSSQALKEFSLDVGSHSIVGWVTKNNRPWIAPDVSKDPYYLPVPDLPETRSEAGIPLSVGSEVLGMLDVQNASINAFTDDDVATLQTLANQIATTIKNVQLLEAAQVDLQSTSLLYRASHQIAEAETTEDVFQALKTALKELSVAAALFAVDPEIGQGFHRESQQTTPLPESQLTVFPTPAHIDAVFPSRAPIEIQNGQVLDEYPEPLARHLRQLNYSSMLLFPIRTEQQFYALLCVDQSSTSPLPSTTRDAINSILGMITTALEKVHALETIQQQLAELKTLTTISQSISSEVDLNNLYTIIHQQILQAMGEVNFLIALYTPETNLIEIPYMDEGEGVIATIPSFPLGEGLTSILIKTRQPLMIVEDTVNRSKALGAIVTDDKPAKSWLGVPLMVGGDAIGAIVVQDLERENRFDEDDLRLLTVLAAQVAIAVRNARLIESAQEKSNRDRQLFEITSRIRRAVDIQSVLEITTRELNRVFNARRTQIDISLPIDHTQDSQISEEENT